MKLFQKYRVKEFNPIYDEYFADGKGWIFVTNNLLFISALIFSFLHSVRGGYKTEIVKI